MKVLKSTFYKAFPLLILLVLSLCSEPEMPRPEITDINPGEGSIGTPISITGKNFAGVQSILFGSTATYAISKSETVITTVVPPGVTPGNSSVTVKSEGGVSNAYSFLVLPSEPEITSIEPDRASVGTSITIKGKFLATAASVNFGDKQVTTFESKTDDLIKLVVPDGLSPGALDVFVTTTGGPSPVQTFTVVGKPVITAFTPGFGPIGKIIAITGLYFEDASKVYFDTAKAVFSVKSASLIEATVPVNARSGKLKVITPGGSSVSSTDFTVKVAPVVTSFAPSSGIVGTVVTIMGSGFDGTTAVKFGAGLASEIVIVDDTKVTAKVPANATSGKITIEAPGGSASSTGDFTLLGTPSIASLSPTSGIVGTTVTITGANFVGVSGVKFNSTAVAAGNFTVVSTTQISAKVPSGATTGKIKVETSSTEALSTADFTVIGAPSITSFTPTSGAINAEVTITGTNLLNASAVRFNGTDVSAGNYTVMSATQVKAKIPAGATTGKISVVTSAGTATSAADFTILVAPTITSFNPPSGAGGSTVVITGSGFTGTTSVRFNGIEAGSGNFTVNSGTQITATVPGGATSGKISVTNPQGTATSANTFYVTPFIASINPTTGNVGAAVTITGTNLDGATVKFNSTSATPTNNTSTSITVAVPAGVSGAVNVTVVNAGGTSNSKTFTVASIVVINEIIATENITDQLLLLNGNNLQNATKVMFGTTQASIFTNTSKVVTTKIPTSLTPGNYAVTLVTSNGTSNAKDFEVLATQNPNTGDVNMVNGANVVNLPPGYVPPVSNQWYNTFDPDQRFLISEFDNSVVFSINFVDQATGTITFDKPNNYVEIVLAGIRYVGVWTPKSTTTDINGDPHCFAHMTLISAESGKQLELAVEYFDSCP